MTQDTTNAGLAATLNEGLAILDKLAKIMEEEFPISYNDLRLASNMVAGVSDVLLAISVPPVQASNICVKVERVMEAFRLYDQAVQDGFVTKAAHKLAFNDIMALLSEISHEAIKPVPTTKPVSGIALQTAKLPKLSPGDVKVGDVVRLISGGPRMVVADVRDVTKSTGTGKGRKDKRVGQIITCNWFNRLNGHENWGLPATAQFDIDLLDSEV